MRTLPPIFHRSYQSHSAPGKWKETFINPIHQPFPAYCELLNSANVAPYPSPPMSGSPSPSRHRCANPDDKATASTLSGPPREAPRNSPEFPDARANPSQSPRPLLPQSDPRYLPPPTQPPWPLTAGLQPLPPVVSYETAQFTPSARPPTSIDRFPPSIQSNPSLESSQIVTSTSQSPPHSRIVRKGKSHVASACINCKKAHLSCDVGRPCGRCISSGKQDTCKDVPHKKRGRPKLKTDATNTTGVRPTSALEPSRPMLRTERYSLEGSFLRTGGGRGSSSQGILPRPRLETSWSRDSVQRSGFPAGNEPGPIQKPIAFMDEDLRIVRMNQAFYNNVGPDAKDKDLCNLVTEACRPALQTIRSLIMDERISRNPAYLPPVLSAGESDAIPRVEEVNIADATKAYTDHTTTLEFRRTLGMPLEQFARLRLAMTDVAFIVLELVTTTAPSYGLSQEQQPRAREYPHLLPHLSQPPFPASSTYLASNYPAPYSQTPPAYNSAPHSPFYNIGPLSAPLPGSSPTLFGITSGGLHPNRYDGGYFPPPTSQEPAYGYTQAHSPYSHPAEQRSSHPDPYRPAATLLPPIRSEVPSSAYSVAADAVRQTRTRQREDTPPEERGGQSEERRGHKRRRTEMDIRKVLDQ